MIVIHNTVLYLLWNSTENSKAIYFCIFRKVLSALLAAKLSIPNYFIHSHLKAVNDVLSHSNITLRIYECRQARCISVFFFLRIYVRKQERLEHVVSKSVGK